MRKACIAAWPSLLNRYISADGSEGSYDSILGTDSIADWGTDPTLLATLQRVPALWFDDIAWRPAYAALLLAAGSLPIVIMRNQVQI